MNNEHSIEMQTEMQQAFEETSELSPLALGALKAYQESRSEEKEKPERFKYIPTGRQATPNMLAMLKRRVNAKYHRA